MRHLLPTCVVPLLVGCAGTITEPGLPKGIEARALTGEFLPRLEPPEEVRTLYEAELAAARARWNDTGSEDDAVWVGRHLAYLGRYRDAIEWYTDRLRDFPDSARLRRHRGHRYLTTRQLGPAREDLERAWELLEGSEDRVEPDGAPNRYGIPRSTMHTNVLYHLGLVHYVEARWQRAAETFGDCVDRSPNDDMRVAALNWRVHALRRMGRHARARSELERVTWDLGVIENHTYHRLLLLQKGELTPDEVLPVPGDRVQDATALYGVATWSWCNGNRERARALWRKVVDRTPWNAFGHLAAEAELARGE